MPSQKISIFIQQAPHSVANLVFVLDEDCAVRLAKPADSPKFRWSRLTGAIVSVFGLAWKLFAPTSLLSFIKRWRK